MPVAKIKEERFYNSIYRFLSDEGTKEFAEIHDIDDPESIIPKGDDIDPIELDGFISDTDEIVKIVDKYWDGLYVVQYDEHYDGIVVLEIASPED